MIATINENNFVKSKLKYKSHKSEVFSFVINELNDLVKIGNTPIVRNNQKYTWIAVLFIFLHDYVEQKIIFDSKGHNSKFPCILDDFKTRTAKPQSVNYFKKYNLII